MALTYAPYYRQSWALVIGINTYTYTGSLNYACNDADSVHHALIERLGFPEENIILLKEQDATKERILEAFHRFEELAEDPNDRIFVFYAGHGMTRQGNEGDIGFLVPVDGNPRQTSTLIRWTELTAQTELIPAKHILFVMDACYSGLAMQRTPAGTKRFIRDALQRLARQAITAGKADQTVADSGGGPQGTNSIFTGYLLDGIFGGAVDESGILTASSLMYYVYKKVGVDNKSKQTPHYGYLQGDGDFILFAPGDVHLDPNNTSELKIKTFPDQPDLKQLTLERIQPQFAQAQGYGDPTSPSFGSNIWTQKLGELTIPSYNYQQSKSWLSIIIQPLKKLTRKIDIIEIINYLKSKNMIIADEKPYKQFIVPEHRETSMGSVIFSSHLTGDLNSLWGRYIRITEQGAIEYAIGNSDVFYEFNGERRFHFVNMIGSIWQFLFFAQHIFELVNYHDAIQHSVNLVGTQDSVLVGFSQEKGSDNTIWAKPEDTSNRIRTYMHTGSVPRCIDPNIQIEENTVVSLLDGKSSQDIVFSIARAIQLAYNYQLEDLYCCNYKTTIFPWNQYKNEQRFIQ